MNIRMSIAILIIVFSAGCDGINARVQDDKPATITPKQITAIRFEESCPISGSPDLGEEASAIVASIGASLIPKLIDAGVNKIAAAVRKAGEEKTENIVKANNTSHLYRVNEAGKTVLTAKCLYIVKGNTVKGAEPIRKGWESSDHFKELTKYVGIESSPSFYYEAFIIPSYDGNSFRIASKHLEVFNLKGNNRKKDLTINLNFNHLDDKADQTTFAAAVIPFRNIKHGTVLDQEQLRHYTTDWLPLPAAHEDIATITQAITAQQTAMASNQLLINSLNKIKDPEYQNLQSKKNEIARINQSNDTEVLALENKQDTLADKLKGKKNHALNRINERLDRRNRLLELSTVPPLTVSRGQAIKNYNDDNNKRRKQIEDLASHSERNAFSLNADVQLVQDANKFLTAIADILESSKDDIATALKTSVSPSAKATAKKAKADALEAKTAGQNVLLLAALQADNDVKLKQAELALLDETTSPVQYVTKFNELEVAKFNANEKRRLAGLPAIHVLNSN